MLAWAFDSLERQRNISYAIFLLMPKINHEMIKKITLGLLATIGALSIILVSYSYFIKKREEGKGVTDNSKSNQLT